MPDLRNLTFEHLLIYIAVIETGSLTRAAERLGIGKTAVSKSIQRLELELGATLLARTTRRIGVTEAGAAFFDAARRIAQLADEAVTTASPSPDALHGTLRVAASVEFSAIVLAPVLARLRDAHPALRIEMVSNDRLIDLIAEGVDVAIRLGQLADSSHRAVRVGQYEKWLVASPALLARHAPPAEIGAAVALPFVGVSVLAHPSRCRLHHTNGQTCELEFDAGLTADTVYACRAAVAEGAGLALLPDFAVRADIAARRLVRVYPAWATATMSMHALLPPGRHMAPKVRALIERLQAHLGAA
ncbi:LysR family transcriptional regulator [Burkholderia perseverans]|uniref:LysR family transcriptional regulator n=1 Tax=Burkholderia perseverans TaxID=2615214 RepID=UPI001FF03F0D|nr:LysR family transcriptional regulator [Burkholderia perseverans]